MSTICTPAYVANFELEYIYLYIKDETKMFFRFTDNLFMTYTGSKQYLLDVMSDLNKKCSSTKFEFKYSQRKIDFLDVIVYKDENNILRKTIYRKQTDRQNYLDIQQPSFTDKTNLSSQQESLSLTKKMINQFQKLGYNKSLIEQQTDKVNLQQKAAFERKKENHCYNYLFIALKCNRPPPKITTTVMKHYHLLHTNSNLAEIFQNPPILALR